ncbi:MAG: P-loop NTPase [Spirochaetales bacterium]|nr:P-loop NTPase [Spirochaetales bacterium]MCF7938692.1 P-loop NTPase [Spirochaetales bacterium]
MRVLPIASGKGGVGKSLLAANLAIALTQQGKSVVLADLDLGGSNLHIILGTPNVKLGIGSFLNNKDLSFDQIIVQTEYPGLRFVPGDAEIPGIANLQSGQKGKLIRRLKGMEADYLVLDLGAGTNFNTLDFFLMSGRGMIITTPNLTATVNAYLFLKNAMFRIMASSMKKKSEGGQYLESLKKEGQSLQRVYIPRLLDDLDRIDPKNAAALRESISRFRPRLVFNMLEDPKDADRAGRLRKSVREYLGIDLEHLGVMYRDDMQDIALSSRLPIITYKPESVLSQAVARIADKLIQLEGEDEGFLEFESVDESYQVAEMEAETDFDARIGYVEDLLHSGALTTGDLVETVKQQQYEITQLKKENRFLKQKLTQYMQKNSKA